MNTIEAPCIIVENFFAGAGSLREGFEAHFRDPQTHGPGHQVWEYHHVPDVQTCLRTAPSRVLVDQHTNAFLKQLNEWAVSNLGLSLNPRLPLSLNVYVNGCGQALQHHARDGVLAFSYSLTKWDERRFQGGELTVLRPEGHLAHRGMRAGGRAMFSEKVPAKFNQLVVYDERVIHGVPTVQGTMNPLDGRISINGLLVAEMGHLTGALSANAQEALAPMGPLGEHLKALSRSVADHLHGFVTCRAAIQPDGRVASVRRVVDRVLPLGADRTRLDPFRQELTRLLASVTFPPAQGPSELTWPVIIG